MMNTTTQSIRKIRLDSKSSKLLFSNQSSKKPAFQRTPSCADYSPNHLAVTKQLARPAATKEQRFRIEERRLEQVESRPHSYEDPSKKRYAISNSGSFTRAVRFKNMKRALNLKSKLLLNKTSDARFADDFYSPQPDQDLSAILPGGDATRPRPQTQQRQATEGSTPGSPREKMKLADYSHARRSPDKTLGTTQMSFGQEGSPAREQRPGPADYNTNVNSCLMGQYRRVSIPKATRF